MPIDLSGLNFFMPIFSFLLVFFICYAILNKIKIIDNKGIHILISFILAAFFIVNLSLVEFVEFSSAWFVVFLVCIFLILLLVSFTHGKLDAIIKPGVAWFLVAGLIIFFIVSSAYVFNWAINWARVWRWFHTEWFGFSLVVIIAIAVSWILVKKN